MIAVVMPVLLILYLCIVIALIGELSDLTMRQDISPEQINRAYVLIMFWPFVVFFSVLFAAFRAIFDSIIRTSEML